MTQIVDQPAPVARPDRRPAWDLVIEHVEGRRAAFSSLRSTDALVDRVIADMRDRDAVGRARYSVPLTSGNGRDHLQDAYAEALDMIVYLAAELDERGVGLDEPVNNNRPDCWRLVRVQSMVWDLVRTIIQLRALIEQEFVPAWAPEGL